MDPVGELATMKRTVKFVLGFALLGAGPDSLDYVMDFSNWQFQWETRKADFGPYAERWLKRIRNHPSILMYTTNANFYGHNQDQNPRYIGRQGWPVDSDKRYQQVQAAGAQATSIIKEIDPTRPVFTHMGGQTFGDVFATNHYLNFIPLQEREEWMGYWAQQGSMPYLAVEFGTPLSCCRVPVIARKPRVWSSPGNWPGC